jgi:hypothetical protein
MIKKASSAHDAGKVNLTDAAQIEDCGRLSSVWG